MMLLTLTDSEARSLQQAVARRVADMMTELVHTDEKTAHEQLKASYEELERLQRRLMASASDH